tara:strand:+ start:477 stop:719 length:243 start_codon:yes stop_codon:yes gene_type:complete
MAPPLTVVVGDKGNREWKPAEYEDDTTYSHLVEIAKTGRARCRRCVRARRTLPRQISFRFLYHKISPPLLTLAAPVLPAY